MRLRRALLYLTSLFSLLEAAAATTVEPILPRAERKHLVLLKRDLAKRDVDAHFDRARALHRRSISATRRGPAPLPPTLPQGVISEYAIGDLRVYSGEFAPEVVEELRRDPGVDKIEPFAATQLDDLVDQKNAPSSLRRLSTRDGLQNPFSGYRYDDRGDGGEMWAYVADTGIRADHEEFGGRAVLGKNLTPESGDGDELGHGTHIAGLIGGKTYGVLKKVRIIAVKRRGDPESTMAALEWIVRNITAEGREGRSVVNFSSTGITYVQKRPVIIEKALEFIHDMGILVVVSAGQTRQDVHYVWPAGNEKFVTVGNIEIGDRFQPMSNFGSGVDVFARGMDTLSSAADSPTATGRRSGTSHACAYVTGLALYLMKLEGLTRPADVKRRIIELSVKDRIRGLPEGTPNRIAYNGIDGPEAFRN